MQFGENNLYGLAIARREDRAQHFVPAHDFIKARFECTCVEPSFEAQSAGQVISSAAGFQLVQKPQALLRKRERQRAARKCAARHATPDLLRLRVTLNTLFFEQVFEQFEPLRIKSRLTQIVCHLFHVPLFSLRLSSSSPFNSAAEMLFTLCSTRAIFAVWPGFASCWTSARARASTVVASKTTLNGNCVRKTCRTRASRRVAFNEWPPRSKKLSLMPMGLTPRISCHSSTSA